MKIKSGYDIIVKSLLLEGVEYIFGYPGGTIMPIYDALYRYSSLDLIVHILSRHEQGAIFAAQGYARVSKKVGICFATSGPGTSNFITGLADSFTDRTSVICICGQVSSNLLGQNSFQETNIIDISTTITNWNAQALLPTDIGISLQKAFYLANHERSSPILIDITKDAQFKKSSKNDALYKIEFNKIDRYCPYPIDRLDNIQLSSIEKANKIINSSKKTLVLVGQGIGLANCSDELKKMIEKADIPLSSSLLGVDIIDNTNTLSLGLIGMHGNYATNLLTNQSDVLIALGMRFDDRITGNINLYARKAQVIHIDNDPCEIGKQIYCHISIIGDCKQILPLITEKLRKTTKKVWVDLFYKTKKCEEKVIIRDFYTENDAISMVSVISQVNLYKDIDAILVSDVGQHQMVCLRYFYFPERYNFSNANITSGGQGTMGFALPAAIGTQLVYNDNQIICFVGDGSIQMSIQEIGAIEHNKLPIKIFLLNNCYLGMVRQWQELFFSRRYAYSKLINPYFNKVAKSYKLKSKKVLDRTMLVQEVKEALEYTKAYFLEVVVEKEENVFPIIPGEASVDEVRLN